MWALGICSEPWSHLSSPWGILWLVLFKHFSVFENQLVGAFLEYNALVKITVFSVSQNVFC